MIIQNHKMRRPCLSVSSNTQYHCKREIFERSFTLHLVILMVVLLSMDGSYSFVSIQTAQVSKKYSNRKHAFIRKHQEDSRYDNCFQLKMSESEKNWDFYFQSLANVEGNTNAGINQETGNNYDEDQNLMKIPSSETSFIPSVEMFDDEELAMVETNYETNPVQIVSTLETVEPASNVAENLMLLDLVPESEMETSSIPLLKSWVIEESSMVITNDENPVQEEENVDTLSALRTFIEPEPIPAVIAESSLITTTTTTATTTETAAKETLSIARNTPPCIIKVLGVGGGGGNAVNHMIQTKIDGVSFWAINTDAQALAKSLTPNTLNIGKKLTRGLGAGGSAAEGTKAALENIAELKEICNGADMVFITAG